MFLLIFTVNLYLSCKARRTTSSLITMTGQSPSVGACRGVLRRETAEEIQATSPGSRSISVAVGLVVACGVATRLKIADIFV